LDFYPKLKRPQNNTTCGTLSGHGCIVVAASADPNDGIGSTHSEARPVAPYSGARFGLPLIPLGIYKNNRRYIPIKENYPIGNL